MISCTPGSVVTESAARRPNAVDFDIPPGPRYSARDHKPKSTLERVELGELDIWQGSSKKQ